MLWLCGKARCEFTVLWPVIQTKPFQTNFTFFLALFFSHSTKSQSQHHCQSAMALCCPASPWLARLSTWQPGRAGSGPLPFHQATRQSERLSEAEPASGGTQNSHTRVFLPSQRSRAVIAGLSSDKWLFLFFFFPLPDCNRPASGTV